MFDLVKMSSTNHTQLNTTLDVQRQGILGVVFFSTVTTLPCCVFLFINVTMLYTLRSKEVFRETSRYILLFNLLFSDTVQLAHSQSMLLLSTSRVTMLYSVCVGLTVLNNLTHSVSVITLVVMCLERYIAVCFPFRHSVLITTKNTGVVICIIWCFSSLKDIMQSILALKMFLHNVSPVQMQDFCGKDNVFVDPASLIFNRAFTYFLFVLGGVTVIFSYIGIIVAARSASTDKASANKARRTLLLHLLQLGLTLSSTIHNSLLIVISNNLDRVQSANMQIVLYVCGIVLPKCLSSLIYGLRDQTIRPVLMVNLTCQWRGSAFISNVQAKSKIKVPVKQLI
ncbi:odorant receptor 131-2-like [Xiphophorus couchianus]|uniref:G-protein coupled receptors family 1 profile domain-containing protein n=1 Tax=Xiphophorus couchianus TaxID=32473 RepID=A0A3B5MTP5_9TELE|nr:odorant receptor 131-2-like [Xiphophorus couchianus]